MYLGGSDYFVQLNEYGNSLGSSSQLKRLKNDPRNFLLTLKIFFDRVGDIEGVCDTVGEVPRVKI